MFISQKKLFQSTYYPENEQVLSTEIAATFLMRIFFKTFFLFTGASTSLNLFVSIEIQTSSDSTVIFLGWKPTSAICGPLSLQNGRLTVTELLRDFIHCLPEIKIHFFQSKVES